jgi:large subunit ribosomal protein L24
MLAIKNRDKVIILSGKDKGKKGDILDVLHGKNKVVVSKINFVKKHIKPNQKDVGGVREKEAPISINKVMLVCPKCSRVFRPKFDRLSDGNKIRICRKCGEMIA